MFKKFDCPLHQLEPIELICLNRKCKQKSRIICKVCIKKQIHNGDYLYHPDKLATEQLLDITLNMKKMSLDKASSDHLETYLMIQSKIESAIMKGSLKRQNIIQETLNELRQKIKNHQETNIQKYLSIIQKQNLSIDQQLNHLEQEIQSINNKHKQKAE